MLENVPGVLSAERGTSLERVVDTMETLGYLGGWLACNALDAGLPTTETAFSLSQVIDRAVLLKSLLTAANCLGIMRREEKNGRTLDPHFERALKETLRFWSNVAEASGTPWREASAPRYVPKLEDIKEVIQTDQYSVARNLTWTECEQLMGFPAGWTVVEAD